MEKNWNTKNYSKNKAEMCKNKNYTKQQKTITWIKIRLKIYKKKDTLIVYKTKINENKNRS